MLGDKLDRTMAVGRLHLAAEALHRARAVQVDAKLSSVTKDVDVCRLVVVGVDSDREAFDDDRGHRQYNPAGWVIQ